MKETKLTWFQLRFPRELDEQQVLAALSSFSGIAHGVRLVFDLAADEGGISHRLGVSPQATESTIGNLGAAVPSLRVQPIDPPAIAGKRSLWQLSAMVAAIRTNDLAAISASLLSTLFPLGEGEVICLRWSLQAAPRPPLPDPPDSHLDGRLRSLRAKLALPGLAGKGELFIAARSQARVSLLTQRVASVLRSLATPHGKLAADPAWFGQLAHVFLQRGRYLSAPELAAVIGWPIDAPDLPGLTLGAAKRLVPARELPTTGRVLGVSDFPGLPRPVALSPKAATTSLHVVGPTGTGKSTFLRNLIRDDLEQGRGMLVVETAGDLIQDVIDAVPARRLKDVVLIDALDTDYAVGFNPFASVASPSLIADQLGELFQRLWAAYWGPRTAQLAHMALLTLAHRQASTLLDLPRLYLDSSFRAKVLRELDDPLILGPDWQWFESLSDAERANVISPLLNKARQWTTRPAIRGIVGQPRPRITMQRIIEEQKVLLVHIPKGLIGQETAQLLGCLVLTITWQALAERTALPPERRHPFGIVVDEQGDFAAAPIPWEELYAQGRKYGAALVTAVQTLAQLPKGLREVVLANARSKMAFALGAADAKILARDFAPALTAADLQALDPYAVAALVALERGGVAPPVTLMTPPPPSPLGTAQAVRESSRRRYGRSRQEIEASLRRSARPKSKAPIGRKPRSKL